MKRILQAIAVVIVMGIVKLPLEDAGNQRLREKHLLNAPMDVGLLDSVGQMGFTAALGGLRSLVATVTYMQAYVEWEKVNWGKVDQLFQLTTRLQPRYARYWEEASWQMAYNAASSYLHNKELNAAVRGRLYHDHIQRGIDILEEGLRILPDEPRLWNSLAEIYQYRKYDYVKAAVCYEQVFRITKNQRYERFRAYMLAQTSDETAWRQAYEILKRTYENKRREPSVIDVLKSLEERLKIPSAQRIPEGTPQMQNRQGEVGPGR